MSPLAQIMLWVFIATWFVSFGGFAYASRHFLPMWASGFRKRPQHEGYMRKTLIGFGVAFGSSAVGFAAGGIAELAGGWH